MWYAVNLIHFLGDWFWVFGQWLVSLMNKEIALGYLVTSWRRWEGLSGLCSRLYGPAFSPNCRYERQTFDCNNSSKRTRSGLRTSNTKLDSCHHLYSIVYRSGSKLMIRSPEAREWFEKNPRNQGGFPNYTLTRFTFITFSDFYELTGLFFYLRLLIHRV